MSEVRHTAEHRDRSGEGRHRGPALAPALPIPPTPLFGREQAVRELIALLGEPSVRLVTLTGPGGIGKTRLALAVAAEVTGEVAFVQLASVADPALLTNAMLQALGVAPTGTQPARQALDDALRDRQLLLVLDNVEHVLVGTPTVIDLLGAHPRLTVLATSRIRLSLSGERVVTVDPLEVPSPDHLPPLAHVASTSGIQMFVSRAQAIDPTFRLTAHNAAAIATICKRLEGLPLAIELAAARSHVLSPQELARRLEHRLEVLIGGPRDAPQRHQTLRETIIWSYNLLSPAEQRTFRRLAVFESGASLGAIAALAAWPADVDDASDVVELVSALVDHNLVMAVVTADDQETRIEMAGAIRELALEQLAASDEFAATRDAHAAVYLALAREGEAHMVREVVPAWLDQLEREHANFRAALAWTLRDDAEPAQVELGARLAGTLWLFWYYHSHLVEGRRWLERALARPEVPTIARGHLLLGLGTMLHFLGQPEQARSVLIDGLRVLNDIGDLSGAAYSLSLIGTIAEDIGMYSEAEEVFTEANALFTRLKDQVNIAVTRHHLGVVAFGQGDLDLAIERLENALALSQREKDPWSTAASLSYLGLVRAASGDIDGATDGLREALALYSELGTTERTVEAIRRVAVLATARHDMATAIRLFAATDALGANLGTVQALPERELYDHARREAMRRLLTSHRETEAARGGAFSMDEALEEADRLLATATQVDAAESAEHADESGLSRREREVLRLIVDGASNEEIAAALEISRRTAAQHVGSILGKLGASNRTAATTIALRRGLV